MEIPEFLEKIKSQIRRCSRRIFCAIPIHSIRFSEDTSPSLQTPCILELFSTHLLTQLPECPSNHHYRTGNENQGFIGIQTCEPSQDAGDLEYFHHYAPLCFLSGPFAHAASVAQNMWKIWSALTWIPRRFMKRARRIMEIREIREKKSQIR